MGWSFQQYGIGRFRSQSINSHLVLLTFKPELGSLCFNLAPLSKTRWICWTRNYFPPLLCILLHPLKCSLPQCRLWSQFSIACCDHTSPLQTSPFNPPKSCPPNKTSCHRLKLFRTMNVHVCFFVIVDLWLSLLGSRCCLFIAVCWLRYKCNTKIQASYLKPRI